MSAKRSLARRWAVLITLSINATSGHLYGIDIINEIKFKKNIRGGIGVVVILVGGDVLVIGDTNILV
jgi:hypothetical protein